MLVFEGEPYPKGHPAWLGAAELGFELDLDRVAEGYDSATQEMENLAYELSDMIQYMFGHPQEVAHNPKPFQKEVDGKRTDFQEIQGRADTLWNPRQINPFGIAGCFSNPALLEHVGLLKEAVAELAKNENLQPYLKRYERAHFLAQSRLEICDLLLTPIDSPTPSTSETPLASEENDAPTQS